MLPLMSKSPVPRCKSWIKWRPTQCIVNRQTFPHATNGLSGPCVSWTHNGCLCNQYVALAYRHQVATPSIVRHPLNRDCRDLNVMRHFHELLRDNYVFLIPWKRSKVVNSYKGPWRAKYFQAQQDFHRVGLLEKHARVTLFCKDDHEMGVPEKAPRAIQFRNPIFALAQARFTKPIEAWFYSLKDHYDTYIIGKKDPFTIARELLLKSSHFVDPVYLMLDASKFDAHVDVLWLEYCFHCYLSLFPRRYHRQMAWLWKKTYVNRGSSRKGIKFKTFGTRMSGDMDTGLGNSLIMYSMLKQYLFETGVTKHSIMVNGDDSLVVIERIDLPRAREIGLFAKYGFKMKFEVAFSIHRAEFCQARLIDTHYGPTMSRKPERIMGRTSWTTRNYGRYKAAAYVNTLGQCERAASFGVPIASALATEMIRAANTSRMVSMKPWLAEHYASMRRWWKVGPPVVSLEARISFSDAWDISVEEQMDIESSIVVNPVMTRVRRHEEEYNDIILRM